MDVKKTIELKKSIRKYKDQPIPEEITEYLSSAHIVKVKSASHDK